MEKITKEMNVLEAMSVFPKVSTVLTQNNIKSLKVLESLGKNIQESGKDVDHILEQINKQFEESQKPVEVDTEKVLDVTKEAAEEFKKLLEKKNKKGWAVRLLVHSPSPNKYSYAMDFEKRQGKDDLVIEKHGLRFFVSKNNLDTINNVKIEFDSKQNGFRFTKM